LRGGKLGTIVYRYRRRPGRETRLIKLLLELAHRRPEEGFPKLFQAAAAAGSALESQASASRVLQLELNNDAKGKRRLPTRNPAPLQVTQTNE